MSEVDQSKVEKSDFWRLLINRENYPYFSYISDYFNLWKPF